MRLKIFSLFVTLQFLAYGIFMALPEASVAVEESSETIHAASVEPVAEHVRFAAQSAYGEYKNATRLEENSVKEVLAQLPENHYETLKQVIIDENPKARRGLGGKSMIILRGVNMSKAESTAVLVHEMGHVTDLGHFNGTQEAGTSEFKDGQYDIYKDDLSLAFYRIAWENERQLKRGTSNLDFVSGYAMSDPFEDFAETYAFYVLHNRQFRLLASTNGALAQKYRFMNQVVFNGETFEDFSDIQVSTQKRPWDITTLSYSLDQFLNS